MRKILIQLLHQLHAVFPPTALSVLLQHGAI